MVKDSQPAIVRLALFVSGLFICSGLRAADDQPNSPPTIHLAQEFRGDDVPKELRRLGATVVSGEVHKEVFGGSQIMLGSEWHGTSDDLKLLRRIPDLERLAVLGAAINDDDLKQVDALNRLNTIELYGTKVTAEAAARFAKMHPGIKIDCRNGALLGVDCETDPAGCRVVLVQSESAADRSGLKTDDIILKIQDQQVPDFETLAAMIGARNPGDTVTIELRRGNETLKKEVKLAREPLNR